MCGKCQRHPVDRVLHLNEEGSGPRGRQTDLRDVVPPPWSVSTELVQLAPNVSSRKSRSSGFVACHMKTEVGVLTVFKLISVPPLVTVQVNWGKAAPSITAFSKSTPLVKAAASSE